MSGSPEPEETGFSAEDDAVWRDLVARLEATDSLESRAAPVAPRPELPPPAMDPGPRSYEATEEDSFSPEEPPSLANAEPALVLAWIGAIGAPLSLLVAAMFVRSAPATAIIGIIAVFLISAGYLVFRLPGERSGTGDDDGAVL